jgi:hypothetical protein
MNQMLVVQGINNPQQETKLNLSIYASIMHDKMPKNIMSIRTVFHSILFFYSFHSYFFLEMAMDAKLTFV